MNLTKKLTFNSSVFVAGNVRQTFHFVGKSREFFRKSQLHQQAGNDQWSLGNRKGVNLYFWGGWRIWKKRMRMNTAIARTCLNIFTIGLLNIWNMKPSPILFQHKANWGLQNTFDVPNPDAGFSLNCKRENRPEVLRGNLANHGRLHACEIVINSAAPQLCRLPYI